jgi:hypothetical protein
MSCNPSPLHAPGTFAPEAFTRAYDATVGNVAGACRASDVDIAASQDPLGGACQVGWTDPGEWLDYDFVADAAGAYAIDVRVASLEATKTLHVRIDGADTGVSVIPPGTGWAAFEDRAAGCVPLAAGAHTLRVVFDTGLVNLSSIALTQTSCP